MILESLTLRNFRVFGGEQYFDLKPRTKYGKKRSIILFGGLNGAGKTTILTAIRLALYGRLTLGHHVSKREYDDFLGRSIHRSKHHHVEPDSAEVELAFSYASMGVVEKFVVKRSWKLISSGVQEDLSLIKDGEMIPDMSVEHCQGFLNELIPIGVSDLFFFDGEKIAELAEDTTGEALGDAIKKLLGLDVIETLDADLGILLRGQARQSAAIERREKLQELEGELHLREQAAIEALSEFEQLKPEEVELQATISRLETQLSARGGAWAASRDDQIRRQAELGEEKRQVERAVREILENLYPLSLAPKLARRALKQLYSEAESTALSAASRLTAERVSSLDQRLAGILNDTVLEKVRAAVNEEFSGLFSPQLEAEIVHGISERSLADIQGVLTSAMKRAKKDASSHAKRLLEIDDELDAAGKNIARAPAAEQLQPIMDQIAKAHESLGVCKAKQKQYLEENRLHLREAIAVARRLEQESSRVIAGEAQDRTARYANSTRGLLKDFSAEMAKRKIKDLEGEFLLSFRRLMRKGDVDFVASIDPGTFSVKLLRQDGSEVDKNELSAGEKQIYAISILEALARTSGRNLPIIIDTPLGRLDSAHRSKLVNHYFPTVSHQVVILSTDTEIDESFYGGLSTSISHAFKLEYDPEVGHTTAQEGYFWKQRRPDLQGEG